MFSYGSYGDKFFLILSGKVSVNLPREKKHEGSGTEPQKKMSMVIPQTAPVKESVIIKGEFELEAQSKPRNTVIIPNENQLKREENQFVPQSWGSMDLAGPIAQKLLSKSNFRNNKVHS